MCAFVVCVDWICMYVCVFVCICVNVCLCVWIGCVCVFVSVNIMCVFVFGCVYVCVFVCSLLCLLPISQSAFSFPGDSTIPLLFPFIHCFLHNSLMSPEFLLGRSVACNGLFS